MTNKSDDNVRGTYTHYPDNSPRHSAVASVLIHFEYRHLTSLWYRDVSRKFTVLAYELANELPSGPDLVKSLNELLAAKDCAVRALVAADKRKNA